MGLKMKNNIYILDWPTGSGKTRGVLNELDKELDYKEVFIVVPNKKLIDIWIKEIFEIYEEENDLKKKDKKPKRKAAESELKKAGRMPIFMTTREFVKGKYIKFNCKVLIIDEWHRFSHKFKSSFRRAFEEKKYASKKFWWNLNHKKIAHHKIAHPRTRTIYLCSATPLNPVKSSKAESPVFGEGKYDSSYDSSKEEDNLNDEIINCYKFFCFLIGDNPSEYPGGIERLKRWKDVFENKNIKLLENKKIKKWAPPKLMNKEDVSGFGNLPFLKNERKKLEEIRSKEVKVIKSIIDDDAGYAQEFAYCYSIIPTKGYKRDKHLIIKNTKKANKSFSLSYKRVYYPKLEKGKKPKAENWIIDNNGKFRRLIMLLKYFDVINKDSKEKIKLSKSKSVLIFCSNRATAKGLYFCLKSKMNRQDRSSLKSTVMESKKHNYVEEFNNGEIKILIVTDDMSESLNLHEKCNVVIHYQLPWTPLRLFQRVGRLTRFKKNDKKEIFCNEVEVGHVVIPGSGEEEIVNRLYKRIKLLAEHHLLPGVDEKQHSNAKDSFLRYLGFGPSLFYQSILSGSY